MKSSKEDLKKRGYIEDDDLAMYINKNNDKLFSILNSNVSFERSIAINILSSRKAIKDTTLLKILSKEKSLYTKIEICNALQKGDEVTARLMINYLGAIGKNQYINLPKKVSKKISYPLPRDIIARTLSRMDNKIVDELVSVLVSEDTRKICEVLDAVGFMLFYNQDCIKKEIFDTVSNMLEKYYNNELIVWKTVLCLSSFWTQDSIDILNEVLYGKYCEIIKQEAQRSIKIINMKMKK
ncbi:hypothetical protein PV797_09110 [Clostridiaceae bacterium M8S5]|nr:hypothetical protein PV797_09110 [Clostridiaceae bacterium M8S5]